MSLKKEPNGRRSVEVEVEVHGTPEEVWHAIATGPGVSSWFMPATVEERDGQPVKMTLTFGPGMESVSEMTEWQPPLRYAKESKGWVPGMPNVANEWIIEAKSGGRCVVRIVHSLFASTDEWDNQLESTKYGWPAFLRTLQLYLEHFRSKSCTLMALSAPVPGSDADVWHALVSALGASELRVGERWTAPAGVPAFSGVVEYVSASPYDALVRLDSPGPGIAALGVAGLPGSSPCLAAMNFYMYGDQAAATVASERPKWEAWMQGQFPAPAE
jgi:uncharacterized protein YndB with AHSA1/START domain